MVRHIRWQILLVVLGFILAAILLSAQVTDSGYVEVVVPAQGGTLAEGLAGWPQYLNPLLSFNNPVDRDICALVFEGLMRYDERGRLVPALAENWSVSLDGTVYTFYLRDDVRWHDGINFSADDVLFTVNLLQDLDYTGPADLAALWRSVQVEQISRREVRFTLPEAYAPFLDFVTIGMLPAHLLRDVPAGQLAAHAFNRQPVGTGRFKVTHDSWVDGSLFLEASTTYWDGEIPKMEGIEFRFYPDHASALTALEQGEVNSVSDIQRVDIARAQSLPNLNLFTSNLPRYTAVLLNLQNEEVAFFQQRSIRQALLRSLNRPALIAEALNGQGTVAHSPISPGSWAYFAEVEQYDHDPDRAAATLEAAGWNLPEKDEQETGLVESEELREGVRFLEDQELSFNLYAVADDLQLRVANVLAQQWSKLGIRVVVQAIEPEELSSILVDGDFEAILLDVDMRGDPDLYAFWSESAVFEGQNYAGWMHREASQILEDARQLTSLGQRTTFYYRFQQVFAREMPALLLYYHAYTYGVSDQVQQVTIGPLTDPSDRFATVGDWFLVWREVIIRQSESGE